MTNDQQEVRDWMKAFGQECPEKPTIPSLEVRKLRAKLILEEALETCHALNMHPYVKRNHYEDDMIEDDSLGFWEDPKQLVTLDEIADGCEDLKVVTEGTLVACGLVANIDFKDPDMACYDPLFNEVMRSNWSKMWNDDTDPHNPELTYTLVKTHSEVDISVYVARDKDGKVIKSPSYSPANLTPIIEEMSR